MRYFGSASQVLTMYKTDREAWEQQSVTIVDSEGTTFLRCTLNPGGFRIIGKPRSIGLNKCFIDCEATFTRDS
jgi:hypothetical protein